MNKMNKTLLTAALAAGLSITVGSVLAESQYGYNSDGKAVSAEANVKLKITVPNLILLRVGDANEVNELAWAVGASSPAAFANGNNQSFGWEGDEPVLDVTDKPDALTALAWTNGSSATLNCAMGVWTSSGGSAVGGPASSDFIVTSDGDLPHPGENLGACNSVKFESNVVLKSSWTYVLEGTPTSWKAGVYTNTVTYTASSV